MRFIIDTAILYHGWMMIGIFMISSLVYCCLFYRAKRAIFGKLGGIKSQVIILQLVENKCLSILIYGIEACCLKKLDINSLDFVVNRFLLKLFKTNNISIVEDCQMYSDFKLPFHCYNNDKFPG